MDAAAGPCPSTPGADLASAARRWLEGSADTVELHHAFLKAVVFLEAGDRPAFISLGAPPNGLIPVWSSEAELARSLGPSVGWFSATGADLLGLLPAGYDLLLDPDGDAALRLRPSAVRREPTVSVGWR